MKSSKHISQHTPSMLPEVAWNQLTTHLLHGDLHLLPLAYSKTNLKHVISSKKPPDYIS